MKLATWAFPLIAAILLLAVFSCRCEADVSDTELQQAFQWFDTLGFPSVSQLTFVRVVNGDLDPGNNRPRVIRSRYGFLMEDKGSVFTVFFPDLSVQTFQKTTTDIPVSKRIGYDTVDLIIWSGEWLKDPWPGNSDRWKDFEGLMDPRIQMFLVARVCAAHGQERLALNLCNGAFATLRKSVEETTWTLQQRLNDYMARACMWHGTLEAEDPQIPRETLLTTFREICKRFPDSKVTPDAREAVLQLEMMVYEDRQHAISAPKPLDKLSAPERVKELIFQLRDQNGHQYSNPGSCDIFADLRNEKSPAAQLVKMDIVAVPQLIEALEDRRFTRSVGFWRSYTFSHYILRVGDAALAILERIAHRPFYRPHVTNASMIKDNRAPSVRSEVQAWWTQYQTRRGLLH